MTTERKKEILQLLINLIRDSPIGCEEIGIDWEEWNEFKSEIEIL